jgi:hypothetical protein
MAEALHSLRVAVAALNASWCRPYQPAPLRAETQHINRCVLKRTALRSRGNHRGPPVSTANVLAKSGLTAVGKRPAPLIARVFKHTLQPVQHQGRQRFALDVLATITSSFLPP